MTVAIIADDLTGAADACARFVACGRPGAVALTRSPSEPEAAVSAADVLAFSTESRSVSTGRAVERVRSVVARATLAYRPAVLFKKIDSTLRGHVGPEIEAALDASGARVAVVTPTFPAMGRTVVNGLLHVTGPGALPPIHVTERLEAQGVRHCRRIGRPRPQPDEAHPDARSHARPATAGPGEPAPETPGVTDEHRAGSVANDAARGPAGEDATEGASGDVAAAWHAAMTDAVRHGARVLVCDAASDDDLDAIAAAGAMLDGRVLWAGSAGLAGALARRMGPAAAPDTEPAGRNTTTIAQPGISHASRTTAGVASRRPPLVQFGAVVFWIGTAHPVTVAQQKRLLTSIRASTFVEDADGAARHLDCGEHLLVRIGPMATTDTIARLVRLAADKPVAGFVMSGGGTAARICRLLDGTTIQLGGEVCPGIPWGWLMTRTGLHWPVVLKSGGFGTEQALEDALAFLAGAKETDHEYV